jgi:hypothetical protein
LIFFGSFGCQNFNAAYLFFLILSVGSFAFLKKRMKKVALFFSKKRAEQLNEEGRVFHLSCQTNVKTTYKSFFAT